MAGEQWKPEEWAELMALGESEAPTREELAEARMLVVAVEGKQQVGLSEGAQVGLGLLRVATQGDLSSEAKQRVWKEIPLPEPPEPKVQRGFAVFERKWLAWLGVLPALAAIVLYWQASSSDSRVTFPYAPDGVPQPNAELLAAQAKWVTSNRDREPFERSMSSYRLAVLEGLE